MLARLPGAHPLGRATRLPPAPHCGLDALQAPRAARPGRPEPRPAASAGPLESADAHHRRAGDARQHPVPRALPLLARVDGVGHEDDRRGRDRRGRDRHRRVRRRRPQRRRRAPRRAAHRPRPARPQRVRAALRPRLRALAVGERDDAPARVRRDRDGALGSPRPRRGSRCTSCSAAPCDARSRSRSTSRCGIPARRTRASRRRSRSRATARA